MAKETKQTCFVISPIGEDKSEIRRRSDQILRHVIKPAVEACGFDPIRADQISEPGMITSQVIQHIVDDPLVVADLTGMNPNVFYELAVRHSIRKPLVQIIERGEKIPFDVAGMRTVDIDHRDLDSVAEAIQKIQKQIKATMNKKPEDIESPISVSLELKALRSSENPEQRAVADFVSAMADLHTDIDTILRRLHSPASLIPPAYIRSIMSMSATDVTYMQWFKEIIEQIQSRLRELNYLANEQKTSPFVERLREELLEIEDISEDARIDVDKKLNQPG